jgi:membrane-bound lytic murein transglycosylase MltF
MEPTFPPFEFTENDKYIGFDIDLANAIGEKMGTKVEVKSLGFDALIPALRSGQIDMIASGMDATPERQKNRFPLRNRISRMVIPSSSARITPTSTASMTSKAARSVPRSARRA